MKRISKSSDSASAAGSPGVHLRPRRGRPSASMAGEVEERILDAATAVFLEYGFAGASLERIAEMASAGKATLYSRYPGKEALFSEVVKRSAARSMQIIQEIPQADSLLERLTFATQTLATHAVSDEVVGLVRMVAADAWRFPSLTKLAHEAGRQRAIEAVTVVISDHSRQLRDPRVKSEAKRKARVLATQILDSVVTPLLIRAILGHDLGVVRAEIRPHIKQTLAIFVAANAFDPFL